MNQKNNKMELINKWENWNSWEIGGVQEEYNTSACPGIIKYLKITSGGSRNLNRYLARMTSPCC